MQVTIKQSHLKAVSRAMAKSDIRYYLNGVLLQSNGAQVRLVATDGHRLNLAMRETQQAVCDPVELILPDTFVQTLCKVKFPKYDKLHEFELNVDGNRVSCALPDGSETVCKAVDGKFPDYSRVIPDSVSGEQGFFNLDYLVDVREAARDFMDNRKASPSELKHNGNGAGAAMYHSGDARLLCLVMPYRSEYCELCGMADFRTELQKPEAPADTVAA